MSSPHETPFLIAPRPVRAAIALGRTPPVRTVSAAADYLERKRLVDDNDDSDEPAQAGSVFSDASNSDSTPRTSSRCSLPSEALEEFLSILRQSSSPSRHRRTSGANTVPAIFPYHHSFKYGRIELVPQRADLAGVEEIERSRSAQLTPPRSPATEDGREFGDLMTRDFDSLTARWFTTSNLSSPISRTLTRNPFQRHPSYDYAITHTGSSPSHSPVIARLSPCAIPLPPPTPGENVIEVQ